MLDGVLEPQEDIRFSRGQILCMTMISRIYAGGLFFARPFRSGRDKQELEELMGFLINMIVFCKMISVRCVLQLPYDLWETFRKHPRTEEVWEPLEMVKEIFTMASFGSRSQSPMVLVGHDRFVITCLRYMSAKMLPFRSLSTRRLGGFGNKVENGLPGTFVYALVDVVMLRYRRDTWEDFAPRSLGRLLDRLAHNLLAQDLDEVLVVNSRDYGTMFPKTKVFETEFQDFELLCALWDELSYLAILGFATMTIQLFDSILGCLTAELSAASLDCVVVAGCFSLGLS
ncbi:unnamed protein product [Symbiodinium sp. KB8]|nr:unnamed protein product [Symbiodinium sp. KB8]